MEGRTREKGRKVVFIALLFLATICLAVNIGPRLGTLQLCCIFSSCTPDYKHTRALSTHRFTRFQGLFEPLMDYLAWRLHTPKMPMFFFSFFPLEGIL